MAKNGAKIVSSALLGLDFRVVVVNGKRYVIQPPTIARIAGAGAHLSAIAEASTLQDILTRQENILCTASALSQFICGTDELAGELSQGTLKEIADALADAYSLLDVQDFTRLSTLGRNVSRMIANQKQ